MNIEQEHVELLPCPFCGGTNIEIQISTPDREGVPTNLMCSDCGASGPWEYEQGNSHAKADDAWNQRAALQSQKPKGNDIMLSGVIRMPFEMAMADPISRMQFYQRAQQALNELEAMQSQAVIDDDHLSIVLDVYDNAMQKAFEGRELPNPCKHGTPEHKAWEKGSKEGKKKREAGLPNPIALQHSCKETSQDREDGFSDGVLLALQMMTDAGDAGSHLHFELIETAGLEKIVRRALQEEMWELAGLDAPNEPKRS